MTPSSRAAVYRKLVRCLKRATATLEALDLQCQADPESDRLLQPQIERLRRDLAALAYDLGRERGRSDR